MILIGRANLKDALFYPAAVYVCAHSKLEDLSRVLMGKRTKEGRFSGGQVEGKFQSKRIALLGTQE